MALKNARPLSFPQVNGIHVEKSKKMKYVRKNNLKNLNNSENLV